MIKPKQEKKDKRAMIKMQSAEKRQTNDLDKPESKNKAVLFKKYLIPGNHG